MEHSRKIIHIMPRKRARSWNMARCLVPALLFLFLLPVLWSFFPTGSRGSQDHDPARPANFGVGFDLAPTYGTAAVSYPNGTVRSIIKIDGDASYSEMMARLSLYSSQHLHRPYSYGEGVADLPRRLLRDMRMLLGLPASGDVYILSKMIKKLHTAAELLIGQPVASAEASIPDFACALYGEDIHEAFNYLGLNFYQFRKWDGYDFMYSSNGAYALHDPHICSNYTEPERCWKYTPTPGDPLARFPYILIVSYGYTYLESIALFGLYPIVEVPMPYNLTLGYNALQDAPNEEQYWERVRQYIRWSMGPSPPNVTRLLVTGDAAYVPKFKHALKEVTDSMWEHELEVFDSEPVFAAARGGAILTMREIWHRSHPGDDTNMVQELE